MMYRLYAIFFFFFFKQKTAYEMRISDWSSDVCSSDLIEKAIADGTFNAGPETMKATSLQIISEKIIDQDVVPRAPTRLLRIRKQSELANNSFGDTYRTYLLAKASGQVAKLQKHITPGQLALIVQRRPITEMMDRR